MNRFVIPCRSSETELYTEICEWLAEHVAVYELSDRDLFGTNAVPNRVMATNRYDVQIDIPDDTDAVQFKLRFSDELEREGNYTNALASLLTAQMQKSLFGQTNQNQARAYINTAVTSEDVLAIAKNLGVYDNPSTQNLLYSNWHSGSYPSPEVGSRKYHSSNIDVVYRPAGSVASGYRFGC